jgi:hypothetical protein
MSTATATRHIGALRACRDGAVRGLTVLAIIACGAVAVPAPASALPSERAFELVSPVFKGGFGASRVEAVAADGESVAWFSPGAFGGAPSGPLKPDYLSRRSATGWSTVPIMPPAERQPDSIETDVSPNLDLVLAFGSPGPNVEHAAKASPVKEMLLHSTTLPDTSVSWELAGQGLESAVSGNVGNLEIAFSGGSPDFCHVLVVAQPPLLPEATEVNVSQPAELYELSRGCRGQSVSLRLVGLSDEGKLIDRSCGKAEPGSADLAPTPSAFNNISADGEAIFFTDCLDPLTKDHQLFVRLGGTRTLEVSKSLSEADVCAEASSCAQAAKRPSADFVGASEDGSRVFFTTKAQLVGEDKDTGTDLYMATIGCPPGEPGCEVTGRVVTSLVQVSHEPSGAEAGVQGVLKVAPDGSHVYFVASGDLLTSEQREALEHEGRAVPHAGADNLYVYEASGRMALIGDLCSDRERSGPVEDVQCPNIERGSGNRSLDEELWGEVSEVQTGGHDGRFLVFAAYARLTRTDTDSSKDVYRYDAETGRLEFVSHGEGGYDANGNSGSFAARIQSALGAGHPVSEQYVMGSRAISEDGSRIVFTTAAPLSPSATPGVPAVYEWHREASGGEGSVSLIAPIASGAAEVSTTTPSVAISPSGNDIFFVTTLGLGLQDTDGNADVYDARLDGGFPPGPALRQPCSGDTCQGPLTNPEPLLVPGSVVQQSGEDLVAPFASSPPKPHSIRCRKGRRLVHGKCRKRPRSARRRSTQSHGKGRR